MSQSFVTATKKKLRFLTSKGQIGVEELWDLKLTDLDTLGQSVSPDTTVKKSLLTNPNVKVTAEQALNELRYEVIKTIIQVKEEENRARLEANIRAQRREMLLELKADKELEKFKAMSTEEIEAELKALG